MPDTFARATAVEVTEDMIVARLADGRTIGVPLSWSWRFDEDLSVRGMLEGVPAKRPGT
jgi:hypothetical protein